MRGNLLSVFLILTTLVCGVGCTYHWAPDPLAGWKRADYLGRPNDVIVKDYQEYIQTLSEEERRSANPIFYFEDGTGQHAVQIQIGIKGTSWVHVLIYDKDNKRIKVTKYIAGHYYS